MTSGISNLVDNVGDAFLVLVIIGVAVTATYGVITNEQDIDGDGEEETVFFIGDEITFDSTIAGQLEGEITDGFLAMAGLVILMVIIFVIRMVRARSE